MGWRIGEGFQGEDKFFGLAAAAQAEPDQRRAKKRHRGSRQRPGQRRTGERGAFADTGNGIDDHQAGALQEPEAAQQQREESEQCADPFYHFRLRGGGEESMNWGAGEAMVVWGLGELTIKRWAAVGEERIGHAGSVAPDGKGVQRRIFIGG